MKYAVKIPSVNLEYTVSPSKSVVHRDLIIGFLLQSLSETPDDAAIREIIEPLPTDNDDIRATRACLKALYESCASSYKTEADAYDDDTDAHDVDGTANSALHDIYMNCNESGSTLRFMISVGIAYINFKGLSQKKRLVFLPKGKLIDRPIDQLVDCLAEREVSVKTDKTNGTITVQGTLTKGCFTIQGNVSSQYISGLLMALTVLPGYSVKLDGALESKGYFDLTIGALKNHGITINHDGNLFTVKTPSAEKSNENTNKINCPRAPEGDWSSAAFLLSLAALANDSHIILKGLNKDSAQKDRIIVEILEKLGFGITWENDSLSLDKSNQQQKSQSQTTDLELDASDYPDIVPYIAVVAAARTKKTAIKNVSRLRFKECDRVEATIKALSAAGVYANETDGTLVINGMMLIENVASTMNDISIETYGDHRMAMTACLIAAWTGRTVNIDNKECVNKSFPGLFELLEHSR